MRKFFCNPAGLYLQTNRIAKEKPAQKDRPRISDIKHQVFDVLFRVSVFFASLSSVNTDRTGAVMFQGISLKIFFCFPVALQIGVPEGRTCDLCIVEDFRILAGDRFSQAVTAFASRWPSLQQASSARSNTEKITSKKIENVFLCEQSLVLSTIVLL